MKLGTENPPNRTLTQGYGSSALLAMLPKGLKEVGCSTEGFYSLTRMSGFAT